MQQPLGGRLYGRNYGAIETADRIQHPDGNGNGVVVGPCCTGAPGAPSQTSNLGHTTSACARAAP